METAYITTSNKVKIIKKALKKQFPEAKISVTKGTGTASGWITSSLELKKLFTTEEEQRQIYRHDHAVVEEIAQKALKEAGTEFYTYFADDGYGTERSCHSIRISYSE